MHNHENSRNESASNGCVSSDFVAFSEKMALSELEQELAKAVYYFAYLDCYNRLMTTFRKSPEAIVDETLAMREELVNYFKIE